MAEQSLGVKPISSPNAPLIVIVGPTASGKSALAVELAKKLNGEIICADSRTIYKGMDIGTAKPVALEMQGIAHHLLSIIDPEETFTVADFKQLAEQAIQAVQQNNKLPILVGGSGLYIDAVLFNYQFDGGQERDAQNPRHAAATGSASQRALRPNTLIIGIDVELGALLQRITARVQTMFKDGLIDEAKAMAKKYGWDIEAMKTYTPLRGFIEGSETLEQATEKMIIKDRQLAKKQRTWFKRNNSIQWIHDPREAVELTTTFLNNYT